MWSLKSREERCKYKIIPRRVIEEETEVLDEKPLHGPPIEINSLLNKLEYTNIQKTFQA